MKLVNFHLVTRVLTPALLPAAGCNSSHKQNINIAAANQAWVGGMVALCLCLNNVEKYFLDAL